MSVFGGLVWTSPCQPFGGPVPPWRLFAPADVTTGGAVGEVRIERRAVEDTARRKKINRATIVDAGAGRKRRRLAGCYTSDWTDVLLRKSRRRRALVARVIKTIMLTCV